MENIQTSINLLLKAVALGLSVAVIVFGTLGTVSVEAQVSLLGLAVFAIALVTLRSREIPDEQ